MNYEAKDYSHLFGTKGFSDKLLENHFALYQGYVKNSNQMLKELSELGQEGELKSHEYSEIRRRLSFELNGIKLHELYFDNMKKDGSEIDRASNLYHKISSIFGSFQNWKKIFKAVGSMRGIGWAVLVYDADVDLLMNTWIEEHHIGHVAMTTPILVMDVWEHAMFLDYGTDRASYIDSFFDAIDWSVAEARFEEAVIFNERDISERDFRNALSHQSLR